MSEQVLNKDDKQYNKHGRAVYIFRDNKYILKENVKILLRFYNDYVKI